MYERPEAVWLAVTAAHGLRVHPQSETLLKIGRSNVSAQFEQRTEALAADLGVTLDRAQCAAAYDNRSALVHGAPFDLSTPTAHDKFVDTFDALQRTLRAALRAAIEQPDFAAVFRTDEAIDERWPAIIVR